MTYVQTKHHEQALLQNQRDNYSNIIYKKNKKNKLLYIYSACDDESPA